MDENFRKRDAKTKEMARAVRERPPLMSREATHEELVRIGRLSIRVGYYIRKKQAAMRRFFETPSRQNAWAAIDTIEAHRKAEARAVGALLAVDRRILDEHFAEKGYNSKPGDLKKVT